MSSIPIHQIVCIDKNGGIGKNGNLPWKLEDDWKHFLAHSLRILVSLWNQTIILQMIFFYHNLTI